ncbi:MAG TPA: hypothetical protein VFB45_21495 [Pseudolabrys sp.]|nr:hypothetical protein [Pseudolabrys sp.]
MTRFPIATGLLGLTLAFAGAQLAFGADATDDGAKINSGHPQPVPAGAPPGVMQQSGSGDAVQNKAAPVGDAKAGAPGETPVPDPDEAAAAPAPGQGPIGATDQTMPAKFSSRNDKLDHLPIMALPLPFSDAQKQQIAQAVRKDSHSTVDFAAAPAQQVPYNLALYPLPNELTAQIPEAADYRVLKLTDKIVLVNPADRAVVGEIKE